MGVLMHKYVLVAGWRVKFKHNLDPYGGEIARLNIFHNNAKAIDDILISDNAVILKSGTAPLALFGL